MNLFITLWAVAMYIAKDVLICLLHILTLPAIFVAVILVWFLVIAWDRRKLSKMEGRPA